jgi:lipopolysaccharide export system ATP-binding protein
VKDDKTTKDGKDAKDAKDGKDGKAGKDAKPSTPPPSRRCAPSPATQRRQHALAGAGKMMAASRDEHAGVDALNKRYKSRIVVHDVSLTVGSGEVIGLLGPNGAGKTTCFYMIVGLVATDGGRIELDGQDLTRIPIHVRAAGPVVSSTGSIDLRKLSVADNVQAILELQGIDTDEIANRLDALLEDLSISHLRDAASVSLSGGERRRVEIARALATRPRFILLDEPFAGIDPIAVLDIQKIIGFLKERGIGVMITDHNVRETLGICDRAYIINEAGCSPREPRTKLFIMKT